MNEGSFYKTITISDIKEETTGVKVLSFGEEAKAISYKPGQYLTFAHLDNNQEIRRSYSITSAPVLNEPLAVGVKRMDNGIFSRLIIDHAKAGDKLITIGAGGFFVLPDNIHHFQQVFFLAAGIGITPIYSLLKTVLFAYPPIQVVLIYSNKSQQDTVFFSQLQTLAVRFPNRLNIEYIFSNAANLYKAHLHADLLVSFLKKYAVTIYEQVLFYICGPDNYMRLCTYTLQREHVPDSNLKKENFNTEKAVPKREPPDKKPHTVVI